MTSFFMQLRMRIQYSKYVAIELTGSSVTAVDKNYSDCTHATTLL